MTTYTQRSEHPFEFRGNANEWFGIWIVNLLLTIVTLGIYSAWAKVRTKKYFYQNTFVAGRNFDYHATGLQILIGRAIFIALMIAYSVAINIPILAIGAIVVLLLVLPWIISRGLRFNARQSSWSNVRFGFEGGYGGCFMTFIVLPFLTALTLYLAFPVYDRARKRYVMSNHRLGRHEFDFNGKLWPFYRAFFVALAWVIGVTLVLVVINLGTFSGIDLERIEDNPLVFLTLMASIYAWFFLALVPASVIYSALVRNATMNALTLEGGHRFYSDIIPLSFVWIVLSNAIITLLTMGLMLPWAQIRMARYLAKHTYFYAGSSLDNFMSEIEKEGSAVADAYADLEGFDVGFPI